jgi:uncharacterized protein (DUF2147 family)
LPAGWVAAAGAAVSAGESIEANNAAGAAAKANNANASELAGAQNTMLNQAETVANQPFQAYTGQLTAPMTGNQQQGYSLASSSANQQAGQADVAQGTSLLGSEQPWNQATEATYANPYTQDVVNTTLANQNKSYLQSLAADQTGEGATSSFGNSRDAIQEATLTADNTLNTATTTASLNANAYNAAMSAWQNDNQAKTQAATAYMQAGNDVTNMTNSQISNLLQTGGVSQVINQTNLDAQYGQFMRQQGWSAQQLGPLINAVTAGKGGVAQSAPVQSNVGNSILGLGSTLAGLYGGGSTGQPATGGTYGTSSSSQAGLDNAAYNSLTIPTYTPVMNLGSFGSGAGG